ncbi:PrsW family glutamic-type intramembrane protease [Lacipirellula sp.]|uniref:PrsW family glutamic-type intramembrane protease n=1 Tax=Lacipirellula sp. TaxID=2691419 RepID=UPI003D0F993E
MAEIVWRNYLRTKTRNPRFLWKMVISILAIGVVAGLAVDAYVPAWINLKAMKQEEEVKPEPTPQSRAYDEIERLADAGDWQTVWWAIPPYMVLGWEQWGTTGLGVLTGVCWLAFVMQAIQIRSFRDYRLWFPPLGLLLGVASIWPTLFLIMWQEREWGLVDADDFAGGIRYFTLGVGLREELSKFLCFLPFLPWLVYRRDQLAALLVAGSVGLGFAMEENVGYIWSSMASGTLSRLMMPAPAHMALTGLVGLAAYRACVWPKECGLQFIAVFGVIVLAHGLYDSLLMPIFKDIAIAAPAIFLLLVFQFFRELRPLQALRVEPISLTANFLFCVSTVAAATFVYLCAAVGWKDAGDVLVMGIVAQSVMVYLFLREMPETMVTV